MALSVREYRARIKSTESMKKITRAMELIAASRIIKAQQRARAATPYARELTRAVSAVATYSNVDHPLTTEPEDPKRAAIRESLKFEVEDGLAAAYDAFLDQFETSEGGSIKVGHEPEAEALEDEDQEQIVKQKRG